MSLVEKLEKSGTRAAWPALRLVCWLRSSFGDHRAWLHDKTTVLVEGRHTERELGRMEEQMRRLVLSTYAALAVGSLIWLPGAIIIAAVTLPDSAATVIAPVFDILLAVPALSTALLTMWGVWGDRSQVTVEAAATTPRPEPAQEYVDGQRTEQELEEGLEKELEVDT